MIKSPLATIEVLTANHSGKRTHNIDRFTPHCVVGQLSAERTLNLFVPTARQASCNYAIGPTGDIGIGVSEDCRSWCTSSNANDQRAITVEVASDTTHPYAFKDAAYNALLDLATDICRRYDKKSLIWIPDKTKALAYEPKPYEMLITVHRWFANKACPGDWLMQRLPDFADEVTRRLIAATQPSTEQPAEKTLYRVQCGAFSKRENAEAYAQKLKAAGFEAIIV